MSEKPEALRLADIMDSWTRRANCAKEAAAELRRLHAEVEQLRSDLATLRAQNYETQSLLKGAEAECDALRRHIKLLQSKVDAEKSCACAYDNPDEVCLPHSPLVEELRAECDALRADAERYRWLRRGQQWSVIDGGGNTLRAETLDAAIEAVRALKEPK